MRFGLSVFAFIAALLVAAFLLVGGNDRVAAQQTPTPAPATPSPASMGPVNVELAEWSVTANPSSVAPIVPEESITFTARNVGQFNHELVIIRTNLAPGDLPLASNGAIDESQVQVVGRIPAFAPGESRTASFSLSAGSYVLACNLVSGTTSHYQNGMRTSFTVLLAQLPTPLAPTPVATPTATPTPAATPTATPAIAPTTGGPPASDNSALAWWYVAAALGGAVALGSGALLLARRRHR